MRDLIVICADQKWKAVLEELLQRHASLQIRELDFEVTTCAVGHDGGVRKHGPALLRAMRQKGQHALLVLDYDGCGDDSEPEEVAADLVDRLRADWGDQADAIVVAPELEAWLIGGHRHFGQVPGLAGIDCRKWWRDDETWPPNAPKPDDPKSAVERVFYANRARPTAASYRKIAERASLRLDNCECESFHRFVASLVRWFGV